MIDEHPAQTGDRRMAESRCIVVHYKTPAYLDRFLKVLLDTGYGGGITVVDTSEDRCGREITNRYIQEGAGRIAYEALPTNPGYGAAVHHGIASGPLADFYLICNADIILEARTIEALLAWARSHPDSGILGPRLVTEDGRTEPTWGRRISILGEWMNRRRMNRHKKGIPVAFPSKARRVDWVSGACILVRRETWSACKGFDPRFFLYYEDCDLCERAKQTSWETWYIPEAVATHRRGGSRSDEVSDRIIEKHRQQSQNLYYEKHRPLWERLILGIYTKLRGLYRNAGGG